MKTAVYTSLIATGVLCGVLMLFGIFGCDGLLELIHTPQKVFADSALYLDIYIWGLPFLFFYNVCTGIFPRWGIPEHPLFFLPVLLFPTFSWIYCLYRRFTWAWQAWPGLPFFARG